MTIQRNSKKKVKSSLPNRRLNLLLILVLFQVILLSWFIWLTYSDGWSNRAGMGLEQSAEIDHSSTISGRVLDAGITADEQLNDEADTPTPVVTEREEALPPMRSPVRIEVLNGTGISRLAWRFSQGLIEKGIDVLETSNADRPDYARTRIICRSDDIRQANQLAQLLRFPTVRVEQLAAPELVDIDVTLILGADYQQLQIPR